MKILFVIDTLASGGKERRLTELLKALKLIRGVEFELVIMSENIHYREVLDLDINVHSVLRKSKKDLSVFGRIYKLARMFNPDIIHTWDSMTSVYVAPVCKLLHCKMVNGMVIDTPIKQNILNKHWLRARLTFPFSDVVVGNSEAGLKAYNAPENKSIVIHNGFNFERTKDLKASEHIKSQLNIKSGYVIGMVATFSNYKDYPTYFKAATMLLGKRKDLTFLAIGADTDSYESARMLDKDNLGNFRLLGKKSEIESLINAMDICILSTYTEGISNSIMEYMALGKPVIATAGGGTGEIVVDNTTGFLIVQSDAEVLAGKIQILLDDPSLREKMGSAGRERIKNHFSINSMVEKYFDLYSALIPN